MYTAHFGLRQRPFRPTPDRAGYYPATAHEQAVAALAQGLDDGEGVLLLTGDPGTGKTLLCQRLLERCGPATRTAFLPHSHFSDRSSLLQAILYDLGIEDLAGGEPELRRRLIDRWLTHGLGPEAARARAEGNDMPNAAVVAAESRPARYVWEDGDWREQAEASFTRT